MAEETERDYIAMAQNIIAAIRHCTVLKMEAIAASQGAISILLPYNEELVGNPASGSVHGGALTTLMDSACGFAAIMALDEPQVCPTLDLRIDYMSAGKPGLPMIGRAEAYRVTQNVIFTRGVAYQDESKPVAHCVATFMRLTDPKRNN